MQLHRPVMLKLVRCRLLKQHSRAVTGAVFFLRKEGNTAWMQTEVAAQKWAENGSRPAGTPPTEMAQAVSCSCLEQNQVRRKHDER